MLAKYAAGLLVLPRAGKEHGHVDLSHERARVRANRRGRSRSTGCRSMICDDVGRSAGAGAGSRRTAVARFDPPASPTRCPLAVAACASCWRSFAHDTAKPLLKMPPGCSVLRSVSAMTDSGAIAARCGGWVWRDEELADAGIRDADHADLCRARPTAARRPSRRRRSRRSTAASRRTWNAPPEHPVPRMFTPTVA